MIYTDIQSTIGNTPLVEISRIPLPNNAKIYAKLEYFNPGGSVKDRLGKALLQDALENRKISKKGTLIEPTAGNTGIGLALAAIGTDVSVIFVVPEKFSQEKQLLMKALGAKVVNTPTCKGMHGAIEKANELVKNTPDAYSPAQFENKANPSAYYHTLAPELYRDLPDMHTFVAGAGTGGTFMGCAMYLKEQNKNIQTVIVEPEGSILNGGKPGTHKTEGIGVESIPPFFDSDYFNKIYTISDKEAFYWTAQLAKQEGLLVGSSSGAAFAAALEEAKAGPVNQKIITVFPDSSERYLSCGIYEGVSNVE